MEPLTEIDKDIPQPVINLGRNRKVILFLYILCGLTGVICSLPNLAVQNIGYGLIFIVLIAAYIARAIWPKNESFEANHTTYIIRTIWIYSALGTFGIVGAGIIIGQNGNPNALQPMLDAMATGLQPSEAETKSWLMQYYTDNQSLIIRTSIFWLLPVQIYLLLRAARGFLRAQKNYRIAKLKSWF